VHFWPTLCIKYVKLHKGQQFNLLQILDKMNRTILTKSNFSNAGKLVNIRFTVVSPRPSAGIK